MNEELVRLVEKLSIAIEQSSEVLWTNAVQQSIITGWWYIALSMILVFAAAILIWFEVKIIMKIRKLSSRGDDFEGWIWEGFLLLIFTSAALAVLARTLYFGFTYLLNPEWGAILILKELAGL